MPITLRELFSETGKQYEMKLLGGAGGLDREVAWIHLCEEPENIAFLRGGDLVVTTGLRLDSGDWLPSFLREILAHEAVGLILNAGKYIRPEHITPAVLEFCEAHSFALFTLPWHIRLGELMQDYCSRLFLAERLEAGLEEAVRRALFQPEKLASAEEELRGRGLSETAFAVFSWRQEGQEKGDEAAGFLHFLSKKLEGEGCPYAAFSHQGEIIAVIFGPEERLLQDLPRWTAAQGGGPGGLRGGISASHCHARGMAAALREARIARAFAAQQGKPCLAFRELGIYRLFCEVPRSETLQALADEQLAALREHDEAHHGQLLATLHAYLLAGGSLQATAETLYTHRNTVGYRLGKIRELLPADLASAEVRFALLLAFYMEDYLAICACETERNITAAIKFHDNEC